MEGSQSWSDEHSTETELKERMDVLIMHQKNCDQVPDTIEAINIELKRIKAVLLAQANLKMKQDIEKRYDVAQEDSNNPPEYAERNIILGIGSHSISFPHGEIIGDFNADRSYTSMFKDRDAANAELMSIVGYDDRHIERPKHVLLIYSEATNSTVSKVKYYTRSRNDAQGGVSMNVNNYYMITKVNFDGSSVYYLQQYKFSHPQTVRVVSEGIIGRPLHY